MANANKEGASTANARTGAPESKDAETGRGPVVDQTRTETNQGLASAEGREKSVAQEDERLKRLNEQNREGHEKNMRKIEEHAEQAAANSEKAPPTGKEWNRNTPRIDKDGTKHWD